MAKVKKIILNKFVKFFIFLISSLILIGMVIYFPYQFLNVELININSSDLNDLFVNNIFYRSNYVVMAEDESGIDEIIINYKLFNLFNIKNLKVSVTNDNDIYIVGGNCIGFDIQSKGAIVVGGSYVLTSAGLVNPIEKSELQIGDIITKIDDINVENINTIIDYLSEMKEDKLVKISVLRNNVLCELNIKPEKDIQSNSYKLGLWLKDNVLGIGTLTYINDTQKTYGALGHPINTEKTINGFEVENGKIYNCSVLGVKEAEGNNAGQLLGTFSTSQEPQGDIILNNKYGVYGNVLPGSTMQEERFEIELGGREFVKHGKAKILCCVNGREISEFDIEIIKTNYQPGKNDKNMVVRVIDKELLNLTGGIVQGMSGSPIIQNGKLIGAITHVFLNDASKGFALYIDNMVDQFVV